MCEARLCGFLELHLDVAFAVSFPFGWCAARGCPSVLWRLVMMWMLFRLSMTRYLMLRCMLTITRSDLRRRVQPMVRRTHHLRRAGRAGTIVAFMVTCFALAVADGAWWVGEAAAQFRLSNLFPGTLCVLLCAAHARREVLKAVHV